MTRVNWLIACVLVAVPMAAQTQHLCELLRHPEKFNGKVVKVRATHRYGYEWSQLYCLSCRELGNVWLEIPLDLDKGTEKALKKMPKDAGIVNITVEGVFRAGGTYGHLNGYRYQLTAQKIRDVAVVVKGMRTPAEEKKAEERSACGGQSPR